MDNNPITCDPNLSGNLTSEYAALQNDLEQARCLAADYQNQLSDKTNDFAALKLTLEKTVSDLEKLQVHILALRQERHRLSNEAMRAVALEIKVAELTKELNRLRQNPREFIKVDLEEPDSVVIIPETALPRLVKKCQPHV
jgi:septal ring factor EnvC (AmiA/AmiB activator)